MPSFSDIMKGLSKGTEAGSEALDQLASKLENIDLSKVAKGHEALADASLSLQQELAKLKASALKNNKVSNELLRGQKIRGKVAKQLGDRQAKAIGELNKLMEVESRNRKIGVKELQKFYKAAMAVNKELIKEKKILRERQLGASRWAKNQARQMATWAKASERIEEASEGLDNLSNKLGSGFLGAGLIQGVRGMAEKRQAKLGIPTKAVAGVAAIGALGAAIGALVERQREGLDVLGPKMFNYGLQGYANLGDAIDATTNELVKFRNQAQLLGTDSATATEIFKTVGAETGEINKNLEAAGKTLFQTIQMGIIPAGEASSRLTERINTVGMTAQEAAKELFEIGVTAKASGKIQMEDLYRSVVNVAEATGALVTNQKDLAKTMTGLIKQSDKLGLSYNRRQKAAAGLTQAASASYNQGFAVLELEENLEVAMKSRDKTMANQAAMIKKNLAAGILDPMTAARMLQESGATTEKGVIQERLRRAAIDATKQGGAIMAGQRLGKELTTDEFQTLQRMGEQLAGGASIQEVLGGVTGKEKRAREDLLGLSKKAAEKGLKGETLMSITLDKFMDRMSKVFAPLIDKVPTALNNIATSIEAVADFFGISEEDLRKREKAKKEKDTAERIGDVQDTLAANMDMITGRKNETKIKRIGRDSVVEAPPTAQEKIRQLGTNIELQKKFRQKFKRGFSNLEKEAIIAAVGKEKEAEVRATFKRLESEKFTKATVVPGTMGADGKRRGGKLILETEEAGAAQAAQKDSATQAEGMRANGRRGPA